MVDALDKPTVVHHLGVVVPDYIAREEFEIIVRSLIIPLEAGYVIGEVFEKCSEGIVS
jgi:hypothetical protein